MKRQCLLLIVIALIVIQVACARKPAKKSAPPKLPKIPDNISQGKGKEPVLRVYDIDEKTVKEMKLEDYVAGVVAGEMENHWPHEALAAQAILARTYVLEFITDKGGSKYANADISTDFEEAQAWNTANINDKVKKAVKSTRGKVIAHNGKFVKAWFHSHAGGMTATAKEGLNFKEKEPSYIKVVKSPDDGEGPAGKRTWAASFTKEELRQRLQDRTGQDPGPINEVKIVDRGPSGRAVSVKIGNTVYNAPDLRIALGSMDMRSTLLTSFRIEDDKVIMQGKGFGHGVGLSQWGANIMARQGKTPNQIIKHYFKNVDIVTLWE